MKKTWYVLGIGLLLAAGTNSIAQAASPAAGKICPTVGQQTLINKVSYTCIKKSNKATWTKGATTPQDSTKPSTPVQPVASKDPIAGGACVTEFEMVGEDLSMLECLKSGGTLKWAPFMITGYECSKAGEIKQFGLVNFLCRTAGADPLRWHVQSIVRNNLASIPLTLPVKPLAAGITFANLMSKSEDVSKTAWQSTQEAILSGKLTPVPLHIYVGPNTTLLDPNTEGDFLNANRLWSGFQQPAHSDNVFFNYTDVSWAMDTISKLPLAQSRYAKALINLAKETCRSEKDCGSGHDGAGPGLPDSVGEFGSGNYTAPYYTKGGLVIHEYSHAAQTSQFFAVDTPNAMNDMQSFTPCWMIEGQAHYNGNAGMSLTFADWQKVRPTFLDSYQIPEFTDYSAGSIKNFLVTQIPGTAPGECQSTPQSTLGYGVGLMTVEAMVAVGGIQAPMAILAREADGDTFPQAFESVFGTSWDVGATAISELIAQEWSSFIASGVNHKRF